MTKPVLVLDAHWRRNGELFSGETLGALHDRFGVIWGKDAPIPQDVLADALPQAFAYVAATPRVTADTLVQAPKLKLVAEMSGPVSGHNRLCGLQDAGRGGAFLRTRLSGKAWRRWRSP